MLLRFDPFEDFDRMFESPRPRQRMLALDSYRDDDRIVVHLDAPGVKADDVDITVERNQLTVTAERRWDTAGRPIIAQERPQGTFQRQLLLGDSLDTDALEATLEDGVLTIMIPVAEEAKPKQIPVSSKRSGNEPIETTSSES